MTQKGENILNWSNLCKAIYLVVALIVGFWHVENYLKDVIKETIDKHLESYIISTNFRIKYHEEVIRTIQRGLNTKFPMEFVKPDELRFEDYKEEKN